MADLTWVDALKFGGTSGVVAALANQTLGLARDKFGFRETEKARAEQRAHETRLRQDMAHAEARSVYLPLVAQVREWVDYRWGVEFGLEVDYHGSKLLPPELAGPEYALRNLDRVSTGHPTATVRRQARAIREAIDGVYNMIDIEQQSAAQAGVEDFAAWIKELDQIIEDIHLPPSIAPALELSKPT